MVIVWLLHPKENAGALPPKGNCFRYKKEEGNYFSCTLSFWTGVTVLLKVVSSKLNGVLTACVQCSELAPTAQQLYTFQEEHFGLSGSCQAHLGLNGFPARMIWSATKEEWKPRVLSYWGKMCPGWRNSAFRIPYCISASETLGLFPFSASFENKKQKPFLWKWLTHLCALLSAAERAKVLPIFPCSFLNTFIV